MSVVGKFIKTNRRTIIDAGVVLGLVLSNVASARAGAKSSRMIGQQEQLLGRKLTKKEKFKLCWKNYLLPVSIIAGSAVGVGGNHILNSKSEAALLTAYSVSQNKLQSLQEKTEEIVGTQKATKIKDAVSKEVLDEHKNDTPSNTNIISESDKIKFIEPITGRTFMSTWNEVDRVVNELNALMINKGGYISLNDWFERLHLEPVNSVVGENLVWGISSDGNQWLINISHSTDNDDKGNPCAVIYYNHEPKNLSEIH